MLTGRHVGVRVGTGWLSRSGSGVGRMAASGAAYTFSSLWCTLAVLLAVVAQAPATASIAGTLAVFVAYGSGAGTVLVLLALAAAVLSGTVVRALRRLLPAAGRLSGGGLTLSGAYLVACWLSVLLGTRCETLLSRSGRRLSSSLGSLLRRFQCLVVVLAAVALAAALAATGDGRRRRAVRATA